MERFFDQGGLSQEELLDGLKREVAHHQIFPVVFASASHNIGGQGVIDSFVNLLPSPEEVKTLEGADRKGRKRSRSIAVPKPSRPRWCSRLSQTPSPDASLCSASTPERSNRIRRTGTLRRITKSGSVSCRSCREKQQMPVLRAEAGDIGAVAKLKDTHTGETLASKEQPDRRSAHRVSRGGHRIRGRAEGARR